MSNRKRIMKKKAAQFMWGVLAGAVLFGGAVPAAAGVAAELSQNTFYVDGKKVSMTAYQIGGNNYVRLRDIGEAVGFNVFWDDAVFIESGVPYTGVGPEGIREETVPAATTPEKPVDIASVRQEIVELTNALRKENGLPALEVDELLTQAAQVRADEMAATSIYSHTRPDGSKRTTVTDCPYTTENIHCVSASRLEDPEKDLAGVAMEDWCASKKHLDGMLDSVRSAIGVGIAPGVNPATGQNCWYCVQWFLRDGCTVTWVDDPITQK